MAMTVKEIRAWLDTFPDDALIGISEDDEMCLRPADAGYTTAYLEIGMAMSSDFYSVDDVGLDEEGNYQKEDLQ